ncbi:hypothetical protein [Aeromicrobium sp. CF3.5]|uniref:hypothetical protein n=1 Tax=Aeromicrobium sp. CF3.5 TaxID=3373078 RepID=UPI003EE80380
MSDYDTNQLEAIQAVVDRVGAYQSGAPEGTVDNELRAGFDETGVTIADADVAQLVQAIEAADGDVSAAAVLGQS